MATSETIEHAIRNTVTGQIALYAGPPNMSKFPPHYEAVQRTVVRSEWSPTPAPREFAIIRKGDDSYFVAIAKAQAERWHALEPDVYAIASRLDVTWKKEEHDARKQPSAQAG